MSIFIRSVASLIILIMKEIRNNHTVLLALLYNFDNIPEGSDF